MSQLRNLIKSEDGAAAIMTAIALFLLIGLTALAIDGGLGYDDRRGTQNASDNAALAAAWEACNPRTGGNPVESALAVATQNGYDTNAAETTVTVNELSEAEYEVIIETVNDTTFAGPGVGVDNVTVVSRAVANCDVIPFLGGFALFAGAPNTCSGGVQLDLTGASKIVTGGVHSNGDLKIQGASTDIDGPITYVGSISPSDYEGAENVFEPLDYPIDVDVAEFRPGGSRAVAAGGDYHPFLGGDITNSWMTSNGFASGSPGSITIDRPGIYYTNGDISLNNADIKPGVKVTFVSENGQIDIRGTGDFTAYEPITGGPNDPGLLMFSTFREPPSGPTCTGNAVQWSVSSGKWTGVIFAPNGQARQSTASGATLNGSIIAYTINLSGSDFRVAWENNEDAEPEFRIELKE